MSTFIYISTKKEQWQKKSKAAVWPVL